MASGRCSKRGGIRAALDDDFLESLGVGSFSGVEVLSFSALTPGDRLKDLEGLESLGEVEALRLSRKAIPFSWAVSPILPAADVIVLRTSSSISWA